MSEEAPAGAAAMDSRTGDHDYIVRVIQYLDARHHIRFFITSKDFDVLYRWWEKGIPQKVIREAIDRVVERGRRRQRPPARFSAFGYEVRKGYQSFLSLGTGAGRPEPMNPFAAVDRFLALVPPELEFAAAELAALFAAKRRGEAGDAAVLEEKLLAHFRDDGELNAKTGWFLKNLAPALRRPEIERRYRLNYLWGKFGIPSID
ncbi:MAG TPA: hypothetical protein PK919_05795 [Candidatus Aminicenantes bacterium]|nr:hypothetical protein [Candidatus Aminicenantes bacterium]